MTRQHKHVEIHYDAHKKLFINRVYGVLWLSDVEENVNELVAHPEFIPGSNTLWDLTHAKIEELTLPELSHSADEKLIRSDLPSTQPKFAIVTSDKLQFGLARQLITFAFAEVPNVQVFISMEDALAWLTKK